VVAPQRRAIGVGILVWPSGCVAPEVEGRVDQSPRCGGCPSGLPVHTHSLARLSSIEGSTFAGAAPCGDHPLALTSKSSMTDLVAGGG
jgi:hypothetical protein